MENSIGQKMVNSFVADSNFKTSIKNLCKWFELRSGSDLNPNGFDTPIVFLKEFSEKIYFESFSRRQQKL